METNETNYLLPKKESASRFRFLASSYGYLVVALGIILLGANISMPTGAPPNSLEEIPNVAMVYDSGVSINALESNGQYMTIDSRKSAGKTEKSSTMPHIVIVYIDDQGYNDMGPHSQDLSKMTPHITSLAEDGVWLGKYYGMWICTASRGALLTGLYPSHTGTSHGFISGNDPWGLPLKYEILPNYLSELGYHTHMIGKWHLGHYTISQTPLQRGFDSFYGYYAGYQGFFNHVSEWLDGIDDQFYDLHEDDEPVWSDEYNLYLFNNRMEKVIGKYAHDTEEDNRPFFLYYAMGNLHTPLQAPEAVFSALEHGEDAQSRSFQQIPNYARKLYATMTYLVDEAVKNLTYTLKAKSMFDDTFYIIASDNGGNPLDTCGANNYPLRGMKGYFWEGGMRVNALLRSSLIPKHARGKTYEGIFSVVDWLPTIVEGALGVNDLFNVPLDGMNHFDAIIAGDETMSPRKDLLYNVDYYNADDSDAMVTGAYRRGDMKLLRNVKHMPVWPLAKYGDHQKKDRSDWSNTHYTDFLFNITEDPSESTDLRTDFPHVFEDLMKRFSKYEKSMVPTAYCGAANNKLALKTFRETEFIKPWINDTTFKCPITSASETQNHIDSEYCKYKLLPDSICSTLLHENSNTRS